MGDRTMWCSNFRLALHAEAPVMRVTPDRGMVLLTQEGRPEFPLAVFHVVRSNDRNVTSPHIADAWGAMAPERA